MKKMYLIGNAHIDPVWLWRKGEGMAEVLSTFRSALDRMKEFPDYVFTCACAYYYEFVSEIDPEMMQEIRARVEEGRWNVVGGTWVQTDMNILSAESFARQALYSQRVLRRLTGRMARTGYCVDSFGHNGMTPQLLRHGRMENYVFMRPGAHENAALADLFRWRAPDGSETLTYRIPISYNDTNSLAEKTERIAEYAHETGTAQMNFYGVGNHGGGPTIAGLRYLDGYIAAHPDAGYSGADAYFDDARASGAAQSAPVWQHDLQHHASGCYTANVRVKSLNRQAETALNEAERYSLLAHLLAGGPDERARIEKAWKKVMFNQFHDILAGCTLRSAAMDAQHAFHGAIDEAEDMILYALQRLARCVNTQPAWGGECAAPQKRGWLLWQADSGMLSDLPAGVGAPLVVFNPHAFPVCACLRLPVAAGCVRDAEGARVPIQQVRGEQTNGGDKYVSLLRAEVPALGYATYSLYSQPGEAEPPASPAALTETESALLLENGALRAEFDRASGLLRLTDKTANRVLAESAARAVFIDDSECDTWAHGVFKFDKLAGTFSAVAVEAVDRGPLRASVRVVSRLGASEICQTFTLDAGEKMLRCHVKLTLNDKLRLCRLCFPTGLSDPRAYAGMPGGFIEKAADGREQPCQKWAAEFVEDSGLAILNNGRYGVSFEGGEIRLAIARSALFADHYGQRDELMDALDIGETELDYALMPFSPAHVEKTAAAAELLGAPPRIVLEGQHSGELPAVREGAQIAPETVLLQALKRAECGRGYIVRLAETAGRACRAQIRLPALNAAFEAEMRPQEIATYHIVDGVATKTDFVEPD